MIHSLEMEITIAGDFILRGRVETVSLDRRGREVKIARDKKQEESVILCTVRVSCQVLTGDQQRLLLWVKMKLSLQPLRLTVPHAATSVKQYKPLNLS